MANATLNLHLQEYGTGSEVALALKQFSGMILTAYEMASKVKPYILNRGVTVGQSHQFPATAKAEAEEHNAGTELVGNNQPEVEERTILVDTKQLISHRYTEEVQDFFAHFDTRAIAAKEFGVAIATTVDSYLLRCIALGARQAVRGTGADEFAAGNRVQAGTAGAVTVAYPRSLLGSQRLQDDMEEVGRDMDGKNVPDHSRVCFLTPYLRDVLLQDKTLVSSAYQTPNDMLSQKVAMVKRFKIEVTNNMPTTLVADGQAAYQGDFTLTGCVMIADPTAVGHLFFGGGVRPIGPVWVDRLQAWLHGAKILQGSKWLRPEACGEIYIQG